MACSNISKNGTPNRVVAMNGKISELYLSLLKIPFMSNNKETWDLYNGIMSPEFLDNNLELDENREPKLYYAISMGGMGYKIFDNFVDAKNNRKKGDSISMGFVKEGSKSPLSNGMFVMEEDMFKISEWSGKITKAKTLKQQVMNYIADGTLLGEKVAFNVTAEELRTPNNNFALNYFKRLMDKVGNGDIISTDVAEMNRIARESGYEDFRAMAETFKGLNNYKVRDELEDTSTITLEFDKGSVTIGEVFGLYDFLEDFEDNFLDSDYFVEIQDLQIKPEFQGEGISNQLLNDTLNYIQKRFGNIDIYLNASPISNKRLSAQDLANFYSKVGFEELENEGSNVTMLRSGDKFDSSIKFMQTPNGQIYGMFIPNYNGQGPKVFINPEIADNATVIEEMGHLQYFILEAASKNGDAEAQRILDKGEELFGGIADKWMGVSGEGGNADNRFQIIGEKGAEALDKAEEASIRLDNLKVAKEMEAALNPDWNKKADGNAKKIKLATEWEKGTDGKWRYEIEDFNFNDNAILDKIEDKAILIDYDMYFKKNKILDAYPNLYEYKIIMQDLSKYKFNALIIDEAKTIIVNYQEREKILKSISHEVQHYIQRKEGFAIGANNETIYEDIRKDFINTNKRNPNEIEEAILARVAEDTYKRAAGEVESRNAEQRRLYNLEERRNTLLSETEDVAREDQIILFNALNTPANISESLQKLKQETGVDLTADVYRQGTNETNEAYRKRLIDEIRNKLVAEYGAKSLEEQKGMLQSIKDFFKELYDWFAKQAGLKGQDIEKMTMEEFVNASYNSIMKGEYLQVESNNIQQAIQRNNGNPLNLAPNGKPSILYQSYKDLGYTDSEAERLVAQTYSDEFFSWFGNWINDAKNASKVVDENGQPLVVYHGGEDNLFTVFSKSDVKDGGFFFSNSIKMASSYGSDLIINSIEDASFKKLSEDIQSNLRYINSLLDESSDDYSDLEVSYSIQGFPGLFETIQESIEEAQFLKEENPNKYTKEISIDNIEITLSVANYSTNENYNGDFLFKNGVESVFDDFISNYLPDDIQEIKSQRNKVSGVRPFFLTIKNTEVVDGGRKNWDKIEYGGKKVKTRDIVSDLFSKGKDGVIIQNIYDYASYIKNPTAEDIFVAFNPNQIKSATENIGIFSPQNNDIRYQLKTEIEKENSEPIIVDTTPYTEKEEFIQYVRQHPAALADVYIQNGLVEQVCKI